MWTNLAECLHNKVFCTTDNNYQDIMIMKNPLLLRQAIPDFYF